jgi:4-aminobutyrate aminotransferase-like enzyme/Ser/Thr protein kinase RdoA (MazF antagonist)
MLDHSPRFDPAAASRLAATHFGVTGHATALPSERDQNFLISDASGPQLVLKIANAAEDPAMIAAQQAALEHLSPALATVPRVATTIDGSTAVTVQAPNGKRHLVWAVTVLAGRALGDVGYRSPALLHDLGAQIGRLDAAFAGFDHPAIHRDFYWDLANGRAIVDRLLPLVTDASVREPIVRLMDSFDRRTASLLSQLPQAAIHGDLNDYNVLVARPTPAGDEDHDWRVTGIVDFGDMVFGHRIGNLAIAIAYAILGESDPLAAARRVVRGYAQYVRLEECELSALFGLVALRLCTSVCIAVEQQRQQPDNAYLGISQSAIGQLLPQLAGIPFGLAETAFRDAAGLAPVPAAEHVIRFLQSTTSIAPVLGMDLAAERVRVLDLSVGSPMIGGDPRDNAEPRLTDRVFGAMRDAGVRVSVGRYDEPRLLYVSPIFASGQKVTAEHRTIHLGLDLFAEAGTPVFAPLDGVVHAFNDNNVVQDYGPVIILAHTTDDGTPFYTLYGHLSRESLVGLALGQCVTAGQQIATMGTPEVNVGWTPHLHLQIMTDLLGLGTDFPGVALASQRGLWTALCPDPNLLARIPDHRFPPPEPSRAETLVARRSTAGGNLSIAYREPVKIVRGWKQYLYDDVGRLYVDAYNNVPHVGHCHPRVVEAGAARMRVLNTNTRYLNDSLAEYSARLLATLPPELEVCYLVNSASEANELALRLTRAFTGRRDMIVLDAAYHGNTTSLIDISPYKHAGPGGAGAPKWVHVTPLPDVYRGPYRRDDPQAGAKYASAVAEIVERVRIHRGGVGAFIAETCPSVGGQILLPKDYLKNVYHVVRAAGGVCIADEVQTGLGRMGTSFWAFEDHGVVPDIVVMGKPLGNGHPIGAVATTRAIADAFDNGMEFFSTFGGNTVSCAIGTAVLDVVRDEHLQEHARQVGDRMLEGLRLLARHHELIGDVRGSGLFLGVELVRSRGTLEPAGREAGFVANRMRERGILLGTDGPYHNVIKIRPPMPFSMDDGELLVRELDRALDELAGG